MLAHRCIRLRCDEAIYKWEFERNSEARALDAPGPLVVNDLDLAIQAAEDGLGLAYCIEAQVAPQIAAGRLQLLLPDWCMAADRFHIYYPGRRQVPAGLRALIDMLRTRRRDRTPVERASHAMAI